MFSYYTLLLSIYISPPSSKLWSWIHFCIHKPSCIWNSEFPNCYVHLKVHHDFGRDRADFFFFFPSGWCAAILWTCMSITLITHWCFSCRLAVLALSQRHFSSLYCPVGKELGGGIEQNSWPKLAEGMPHFVWHHAEVWNWGSWPMRGLLLLRNWLTMGQQVVRNCIVHHLFDIFWLILLLFPLSFLSS